MSGTPAGAVSGHGRGGPLGVPTGVWGRMVALFLILAGLKVTLLVGLSKYLYEVHWRVGSLPPGWQANVAFGGFVLLGVTSLIILGRESRRHGVKAMRAVNSTVLGLGLLFIFLTFHTGEKNYIYPIMTGVLKWDSLVPYLSLDLCFRPPFLAAWLFGYVLVYYVLARTGRESWTVHLTALCAGAYALACLRELRYFRQELWLADGLGLASVLLGLRPARKFQLAWLLLPALWTVCFAGSLFHFAGPGEVVPGAYFNIVLGTSVVLFGGATLLARRQGFLETWSSLVPFWFGSFLLLVNVNYPMARNYNQALCLGMEFPRYLAGELAVVAALALLATLYCRLWSRGGLWWLDVLSLGLITVALLDVRLCQIMGVRLDCDVLAFGISPRMMWRMAETHLVGALLALGAIAVIYGLGSRALSRWSRCGSTGVRLSTASQGALYAVASFILLALVGSVVARSDKAEGQACLRLVQTSGLWQRTFERSLSREAFLKEAEALGLGHLGETGASGPVRTPRALNVVLILLESSYNAHLSLFSGDEETQPEVARYKGRMEIFPNFFSSFQGTIHAQFATFASLCPVRDFNRFTLERVNVKTIFEVLHERGYTCSLFYSSLLDYASFREFVKQRGIDEMYDADSMPGARPSERVSWGLREGETVRAIRAQIRKYAQGSQRFFLTYNPAAPHYPYDGVPPAYCKFKQGVLGDYTPLYHNDLLYMDWVLASILDELKESGLLDRTLVVITNDHGEMLGAKGGPIGHGWVVTPELANVPLIIMDPERPGYRLNYTVGSQIDVLPTVLELLGIPIPGDQLYEGRSLYEPDHGTCRLVYLNSYQQYGIIASNRIIYLGDRQAQGGSVETAVAISDEGGKTAFTQQRLAGGVPMSIRRFDEFQENLLRNYGHYCRLVHEARGSGPKLASSR